MRVSNSKYDRQRGENAVRRVIRKLWRSRDLRERVLKAMADKPGIAVGNP